MFLEYFAGFKFCGQSDLAFLLLVSRLSHVQILAIEHRWSDIERWFWEDVHKAGFRSNLIPRENHHHMYQHPKIDIYEVCRTE
jgi:hypothetical protein